MNSHAHMITVLETNLPDVESCHAKPILKCAGECNMCRKDLQIMPQSPVYASEYI